MTEKKTSARSSSDDAPHDRGTFNHPEDRKTYAHPSSLTSWHHIGTDGKPVYSRAQLESIERGKSLLASDAVEKSKEDPRPAFLDYVAPHEELHVEHTEAEPAEFVETATEEEAVSETVPPPRA